MKNDKDTEEFILDEQQCLEIAEFVYQKYEEAMKPPIYIFLTFPEWIVSRRIREPLRFLEKQEALNN